MHPGGRRPDAGIFCPAVGDQLGQLLVLLGLTRDQGPEDDGTRGSHSLDHVWMAERSESGGQRVRGLGGGGGK